MIESEFPAGYLNMPFGERLRFFRALAGMTQRSVADELHVDRSTYAYYETGKTEPRIGTLNALARIFNVPLDDFLKGL